MYFIATFDLAKHCEMLVIKVTRFRKNYNFNKHPDSLRLAPLFAREMLKLASRGVEVEKIA